MAEHSTNLGTLRNREPSGPLVHVHPYTFAGNPFNILHIVELIAQKSGEFGLELVLMRPIHMVHLLQDELVIQVRNSICHLSILICKPARTPTESA